MEGEINDLSIANLTKVADLKRTSTYKFFPHPDDIKIALIERYINEYEKMNILLTSIGRRYYLINYFKKNLNSNIKIISTNSSNHTSAKNYSNFF